MAGFTSAIILAMIAILIGYESVVRLFAPVPIHFGEAIPIAVLGLAVNVASAWLLSSGGHQHGHSHSGQAGHQGHDDGHRVSTPASILVLSVFETDHPPVFRVRTEGALAPAAVAIEAVRRTATTTCVRPWSTSWPMRRCPCW